jgi:hypothetical protein
MGALKVRGSLYTNFNIFIIIPFRLLENEKSIKKIHTKREKNAYNWHGSAAKYTAIAFCDFNTQHQKRRPNRVCEKIYSEKEKTRKKKKKIR